MLAKKQYRPLDAMVSPRFVGIRTFMRLPYVTDLSGVDFAIVGVPFDTGGTFRVGARFGPEGIRSQSMLLRPYNPALNVAIFDICSGVDYGDLPVTPGYLPESHSQSRKAQQPFSPAARHRFSWAAIIRYRCLCCGQPQANMARSR